MFEAIVDAVQRNDVETLRRLLCGGGCDELISIAGDREKKILLYAAVIADCAECVIQLINSGVDVNIDIFLNNITPLHLAASLCRINIARILLKHGAKVNAETFPLRSTPLHFASCADMVELLLKHGAKIDAKNDMGLTPLHRAAMDCRVDVVRALLERGANPNDRDNEGSTPLHDAECAEVAELLIRYGAVVNAVNEYGDTPLDVAVRKDRCGVVEILLRHRAVSREHAVELYFSTKSECIRKALMKIGLLNDDYSDAAVERRQFL
jgi:ankyrin repeat protein